MHNISNTKKVYPIFEYTPIVKSLNVDLEEISKAMGYDKDNFASAFQSILKELFQEAMSIVKPRCGFTFIKTVQTISKESNLVINDIKLSLDKIIFSHLKRVNSVVFFVGTVGKDFDEWLDSIKQEGDPLKEYISNIIGSAIAEGISEWTYQKVLEFAGKKNLQYSNRYSPGYCGWSVSEQHKIFSFFPKDFCGIKLLDSGLMLPIKSVSGIVGVGENIKRMEYPCDVCQVPHCYKNRIIYS